MMFTFAYHNLELEEVITFLYGRLHSIGRVCVTLKHRREQSAYTLKSAHVCNSNNQQYGFASEEPEVMQIITSLDALARLTPRLNVVQYANFGHGFAYSLINPLIRAAVSSVLDGYFTGYPICDEFVIRGKSSFSYEAGLRSRLVLSFARGISTLMNAGKQLMSCNAESEWAKDIRFLAFAVELFLPMEQMAVDSEPSPTRERADLIDFDSQIVVRDLPPSYEELMVPNFSVNVSGPPELVEVDSEEEPPEFSSLSIYHQYAVETNDSTWL